MKPEIVIAITVGALIVCCLASFFMRSSAYQSSRISILILIAVLSSLLISISTTHDLGEKSLRNVDVIFVVDTTYSMNAKDGRDQKSRLENVKEDIKKISASIAAPVAIVNAGSSPYVYLPLTDNQSDIQLAADSLVTPGAYDNRAGSRFSKGFDVSSDYIKKSLDLNPDRKKIVVFMSDGERRGDVDNDASLKTSLDKLKPLLNEAVVIGYGQDVAAPMPVIDYDLSTSATKTYDFNVRDENRNIAYTRKDSDLLKQIASQINATYIGDDKAKIESTVSSKLNSSIQRQRGELVETNQQPNRLYVVPIAIVLLVLIWTEFGKGYVRYISEEKS